MILHYKVALGCFAATATIALVQQQLREYDPRAPSAWKILALHAAVYLFGWFLAGAFTVLAVDLGAAALGYQDAGYLRRTLAEMREATEELDRAIPPGTSARAIARVYEEKAEAARKRARLEPLVAEQESRPPRPGWFRSVVRVLAWIVLFTPTAFIVWGYFLPALPGSRKS